MKKKETLNVLIIVVMLVIVSVLAAMPAGLDDGLTESSENETEQGYEALENPNLLPDDQGEAASVNPDLSPSLNQEQPFSENIDDSSSINENPNTGPMDISQTPAETQVNTPDPIYDENSEGVWDPTKVQNAPTTFSNEFVEVPDVEDTESEFQYTASSESSFDLEPEFVVIPEFQNRLAMQTHGPPEGEKGNKLGNAPEALYRVLQKFLAKGKMPPPNFPVPYVIYTNSSGVEKFTDALTKMPMQLNVDDNKDTGQGNGKDIRVKTTISTNPLEISMFVQLKKGTPPPDLQIYVCFPSFFYNGEAGDPEGEPYWLFGYETRAGSEIPGDITITFSVDQSLGSDHVFDFVWTSGSVIDPL